MFYSQFILAKKGPLGTIWIAAHLERKLRKNQVTDTDIGFSVDSILFPEVPIALRLSSHLLLGVVRIYSKKVTYLFDDCSEALLQIKQAFRSTAVDLPPEESTAPYHSITLPETFDLDDFELPDNDLFHGNYVDHHISSKEQITLQDTMEGVVYSTSQFGLDERFGDGDTSGLDLDEELLMSKVASEGQTNVLQRSESNADPQASVQPMTPMKKDDDQYRVAANLETITETTSTNQVDDHDGSGDHVEYAQAPCTPGLWKEPNLSIVQETSAFDDHLEPENHNLTESAVIENLENATSKSEFYNAKKSVEAVDLDPSHSVPVVDNGHHPGNSESIAKMPEKSAVLDLVENIQNGDITTTESCNLEVARNMDNSNEWGSDNESSKTHLDTQESPLCQEPQLSKSFNISALRPCTTHVNEPDMLTPVGEKSLDPEIPFEGTVLFSGGEEQPYSSGTAMLVEGEGSLAIDGSNQSLEETDIHTSPVKSVDGADNIISGNNQVDTILGPSSSDWPAPEKLLSVPEELANVSINLLPEATPDKSGGDGGDDGSITLAGKKRTFAESASTVQSINADESYGVFGIKMTAGSVPDDDDLLSSILVGRKSSMLKVKSTPQLEMTTKKLLRSATRTGASKRKVLLDDTMVLHGDTIRQQLTNTQDIRRIRKKAPCTRPEISMIQKQFWEVELFTEPIFTGVSMELASLHNQAYDMTEIKIVQTDASLESAINIQLASQSDQNSMHLEESNHTDIEVKEISEVKPVETLVLTDNQLSENITTESEFCGSEAEIHPSTCVEEPRSSEHEILGETTPMEIDGKTLPYTDVGILPVSSEKTGAADATLQICAPGLLPEQKSDMLSNETEKIEDVAMEMTRQYEGDCIEDTQTAIPTATFSPETGDGITQIPLVDHAMEEVREEEQKLATGSTLMDAEDYNAKNFVSDIIYGEEVVIDPSFSAEVNVHAENVLFDGENPNQQEGYPDVMPNANISASELEDRYDLGYAAVGHDTEFLNVDDDDEAEPDGDYAPNAEEAGFIDNSGWSTRTRAVAKYLQILFDKESERGRKVLSVDNLLTGKTRKEASRMFFETLVLKTKDFIHVDQQNPYDNINLLPRAKLMKSDF